MESRASYPVLLISLPILIGFLTASTACSRDNNRDSYVGIQRTNFNQFISGIDSFPYRRPANLRSLMLEKFDYIAVGMSESEIESYLGKPDTVTRTFSVNARVEMLENISWSYYLFRKIRDESSAADEMITVYFGPDGKVLYVITKNIPGLNDLGSPP